MQRTGKENFREGHGKHRLLPWGRKEPGFSRNLERMCMWLQSNKRGESDTGKIAESAGTRAWKMLLKNLDFIFLRGTKKSLKGFKQSNGMIWFFNMFLFTYHSGRIWTPDFWFQVQRTFHYISKIKLLVTSPKHTNMLNLPLNWILVKRKQDCMHLYYPKEFWSHIINMIVKWKTHLISEN